MTTKISTLSTENLSQPAEATSISSKDQQVDLEMQENAQENEINDLTDEEQQRDDRKKMGKSFLWFLATMVIDVGLPLGIYYGMKPHTSLIVALVVSSIPPLLLVIGRFIWKRKVDLIGCLFVLGFILSGIFALATGDARLVLLRDSSVTCVVGLCFLLTLIPIQTKSVKLRPLQFLFYSEFIANLSPMTWKDEEGNEYTLSRADWLYTYVPYIRKYSVLSTIIWGVLLETEFIVKIILIESSIDIDQVVNIGNIVIAVATSLGTVANIILSIPIRTRSLEAYRDWKLQKFHSAPPAYAQYKRNKKNKKNNNNSTSSGSE
ncbi:hypothetical protein NQZ79_g5586 [Umbelopsis isabellina]|nr:hypothetical protein NQZ79_g5586 [Umbelopsis isabellina]